MNLSNYKIYWGNQTKTDIFTRKEKVHKHSFVTKNVSDSYKNVISYALEKESNDASPAK